MMIKRGLKRDVNNRRRHCSFQHTKKSVQQDRISRLSVLAIYFSRHDILDL